MSDGGVRNDWIEANQRLLSAEFFRLRARLMQSVGADEAQTQLAAAAAAMPAPAAIDHVADTFGLSVFERELVLLCAGVEMDAQLAAACATAKSHESRGRVNFGMALAVLDEPHWSALTPARPLRRWRLVEMESGHGVTAAPLRIDERVLHFLAGINLPDARLEPMLERRGPPQLMSTSHRQLAASLAHSWARQAAPYAPIQMTGDDPCGAEDIAAETAAALGLQLWVLRSENFPNSAAELDSFATLWEREAALLPAALFVQCGDAPPNSLLAALAERLTAPLLVSAREPLRLRRASRIHEIGKPDMPEQRALWRAAFGDQNGRAERAASTALETALDGVAAQFRLDARTIAATAEAVHARVAEGESAERALWDLSRSVGRCRLDDLAQRIPRGACWDDLVLPDPQRDALGRIAAQVRNRLRVYHDWGFGQHGARGLGVAALFSGESGTGKTLAAEVLGTELNLDVYRIDLSSVVSKYIGETEKNLRRVFDAAEDSGAILLFDEADALFGKRSDVKDSHDRYANIEVSYLLQRMEAYRGLAILTTNLKSALDPAFQRRLRFIVHFPFPDAQQRDAIWQRAFPADAPTTNLDCRKLARLHMAGGGIRNVALNAAFMAAEAGEPLAMVHLLAAAHIESAKLERPLSGAETRDWA